MLDDLFAEAIVHKPAPWWNTISARAGRPVTGHTVLGVRLRPFSYWHGFNLDLVRFAAENLAGLPSTQLFSSLLLAARCCSVRYPQVASRVRKVFSRRVADRFLKDEAFRLGQIKAYLDYREDYADCLPQMADSGDAIRLPWYLYQVHVLMRLRPGLTLAQAWNSNVPESQWHLLAQLAAAGVKVDILSPEDRRDIAQANAEPPVKAA